MAQNSQDDFDVIVVGGGPGGSTAATFIAMQGHKVLLLERQSLPAYKVGESLLPSTIHGICPMLGVSDAVNDANFVVKTGGTFRWGKAPQPWTFAFGASSRMAGVKGTGFQVERSRFDKILLDNARDKGVDVRERHSVAAPITENGRVVGLEVVNADGHTEQVRARFVVDASGYQSILARHAGTRIHSEFFQNIALFGYYNGAARLPEPNSGNILCAAFEDGWFWYIPLSPDLTSVGAVVSKQQAARFSGDREKAMSELIESCPLIRDMLSGATRVTEGIYSPLRVRADYSYANSKFWVPGLVLIGDAACFIDPVFSSGVHLATYSGLQAARSINSCLAGDVSEERSFGEFERRYRREYGNFYDFLLAFYDTNKDVDSYFWNARQVVQDDETDSLAFLNLVGGVGARERLYDSADDFMKEREGLSEQIFLQANGLEVGDQPPPRAQHFFGELMHQNIHIQQQSKESTWVEAPLFADGLIPAADGLHWQEPVDA